MKKFDDRLVGRMGGRNGTPFVYRPFPGKYPVRLRVRIAIRDDAARPDKWFTRFEYNGHWSYPILRKALRIWNALQACQAKNPNLYVNCFVTEYCQTGVLYTGDLFYGVYSQGHSMAHLFGRGSKGSLRLQAEYQIEKLVPVRCGDFSMMVPEQTVRLAASREQKNILYQDMRRARKRWEAA